MPQFVWCLDSSSYSISGSLGLGYDADIKEETDVWKFPSDFREDGGIVSPVGQISGLYYSNTKPNSVWVLHRGSRVWDQNSFDSRGVIQEDEPIQQNCILLVDRDTGSIMSSFGGGIFFMPHMISESPDGGIWVVDSGSHQVTKFVDGEMKIQLGDFNMPGSSRGRFCLPTEVVETDDGKLFIADGYCNDRVVEFDGNTGEFIFEYKLDGTFSIIHSIAYNPCQNMLYVAARQEGKLFGINRESKMIQAEWNVLNEFGYVYAVRLGMNGVPFILTWDEADKVFLLELTASGKVAQAWRIPNIGAPHDFIFIPSVLQDSVEERRIAVLVSETKRNGSSIKKFILHPNGGVRSKAAGYSTSKAAQHFDTTSLQEAHPYPNKRKQVEKYFSWNDKHNRALSGWSYDQVVIFAIIAGCIAALTVYLISFRPI